MKFSFPRQIEKKQLYYFQRYDFTNDKDWEAQILGSGSSWSQLQNLMTKAVDSGWRNNYKCVFNKG
jgi:hypothetical protein